MQRIDMDVFSVAGSPAGEGPNALPTPVVDLAKYWCALAEKRSTGESPLCAPRWGDFEMSALGDAAPYVTILHKFDDRHFAFEFCGTAVATMFAQDLTGETVTTETSTLAEIDWAQRVNPVLHERACHLRAGTAEPQYTQPIEFLALDLPLLNPDDDDIGYIVGCTVSVVN